MDNSESQIDQQLWQLQMSADATHFREALKLLLTVHNIWVVRLPRGWGLSAKDDTIHTEFATFSEAFRAAMEILEVKGE